jgi:hypothetical protein
MNKFFANLGLSLVMIFFPLFILGVITHKIGFLCPEVITILTFTPALVMEAIKNF